MRKIKEASSGRRIERLFILLGVLILGLFFFRLQVQLDQKLKDVPSQMRAGRVINLNGAELRSSFARLLLQGNYLKDRKDAQLIAEVADSVISAEGRGIGTHGELNKKRFNILASRAIADGGKDYRQRVIRSKSLLGSAEAKLLPSEIDLGSGSGTISGQVKDKKDALGGILIRLNAVYPMDSLTQKEVESTLKTDEDGRYRFTGLKTNLSYEVMAVEPGLEFGQMKGVQTLEGTAKLNFQGEPHSIRLLSTSLFNQLKKDGALIVRTPAEFWTGFYWITGLFFAVFIGLHILLSIRFAAADQFIIPILFLLTGISILTLLSLQDPLRDRFLGTDTIGYLLMGLSGVLVILYVNLKKLHPDTTFFKLYFFRSFSSAGNGWPWVLAAIALLLLTLLFGAGPEGSGVRVNLLGIQPSELVKYLTLFFLAGFFAKNEVFISSYTSWNKRWQFFSFALLAVVGTLLLFLLLGDLGPAMVICFTFIILFSFCRGDFMPMAAMVLVFVLCCWLIDHIWISILFAALMLFIRSRYLKKTLSESALMALLVLSAFLTIDQFPLLDRLIPGPVSRLTDRKLIWQDPWDNEVYGGDQVASGLWSIASGGLKGQGIGEGYGKTIPEGHTDMILPVIAEEFGFAGICAVLILFLLYLHRSLLIARQSGRPLLFYICAGIGVSTFVQFILITGGSIGALPLSGVSLPLMSYGGSSLLLNFLAAGFLLSASVLKGSELQMKYMSEKQDHNLVPALLAALSAVILLAVHTGKYSLFPSKWLVKPALVADRNGSRLFSYNPRIGILLQRLEAGNIYDRKGLLLATSQPDLIRQQYHLLKGAGLNSFALDSSLLSRSERYYPFADQLFFWIGNANNGVFTGGNNGYFAEYAHNAELRGFKMPAENMHVSSSIYREGRFLPRRYQEMTVRRKDYEALIPILKSGLDTTEISGFKKRNRDIKLTVDAGLQTHLQLALAQNPTLKQNRVSVVVLSSANGDVLASAAFPLPPVQDWETLTLPLTAQTKIPGWLNTADPGFTVATQPGSTVKVLTALAAFNKLGNAAARKSYVISANERIRTSGAEPDEIGQIDMQRAIVRSNNVYFIKLANEEKLAPQMTRLYGQTGMFLNGVGGYYYSRKQPDQEQLEAWQEYWDKTVFASPYRPAQLYKFRASGLSGLAWGQGELVATPAAVARLAAGIANDGLLIPNRYTLDVAGQKVLSERGIHLADRSDYAAFIKSYMIEQSAGKRAVFGITVAGKTGTPERMLKGKKINDGWYVFFAPDPHGSGDTVVCIRIEASKGSSAATSLAADTVIPILRQYGYL